MKKISTGKIDDRGKRMIYLGASLLHSGDTFIMFDNDTKRTHLVRNVKMLKKMFFRQDKSISSGQPHPMYTAFENLVIVQDEEVTGDPHTDGVSNLKPDATAFDASDAFSVSSASASSDESVLALIHPAQVESDAVTLRPDYLSSYEDSNPDFWTQAMASTMDETDPHGFELDVLPEYASPADDDVIEVSALPYGATIYAKYGDCHDCYTYLA